MAEKYSKGYYRALSDAHGDESRVEHDWGWHGSSVANGREYDDDGEVVGFT